MHRRSDGGFMMKLQIIAE